MQSHTEDWAYRGNGRLVLSGPFFRRHRVGKWRVFRGDSMQVGDLVRWKQYGDIGIFITLKGEHGKPFCRVYLLKDAAMYHININELEVISESR
mgnify:CR=1 FL=1